MYRDQGVYFFHYYFYILFWRLKNTIEYRLCHYVYSC